MSLSDKDLTAVLQRCVPELPVFTKRVNGTRGGRPGRHGREERTQRKGTERGEGRGSRAMRRTQEGCQAVTLVLTEPPGSAARRRAVKCTERRGEPTVPVPDGFICFLKLF